MDRLGHRCPPGRAGDTARPHGPACRRTGRVFVRTFDNEHWHSDESPEAPLTRQVLKSLLKFI
jgi:hypothetical protein